jgi:gluconokinase
VACSALGRRHRDSLRRLGNVTMVLLDVPPDELARRLGERPGHLAGPDLLASQLASFEPPAADEEVRPVDAGQGVDACVEEIVELLLAAC